MNPKRKRLYSYKGAVQVYEKIASSNYKTSTWAVSEKKARSNIASQFKKMMGYEQFVPVTLLGNVVEMS